MNNVFADQYREFLKRNLPAASDASGRSEISCRCQYCPDGRDIRHGHMYISIPKENDPSYFYCQKCHTAGCVTTRTLIEWGIYDPEIGSELNRINNNAQRYGKSKGLFHHVYAIKNHIYNEQLAIQKISYINNRIGTNLSIHDALKEKIILNLDDLLKYNRVEKLTRHPNIINQLNDNFVGFLSFDNNFINCRRICDEGIVYKNIDKRYVNYNIFDKKDNTEKFYVSPTTIDMINPNRLKVHIAEGPFDILSIKYNLRNNENSVYSAITGSAYKGLVRHLINVNQIYYIELHVYPDNDKSGDLRIINDLIEFMIPYNIPIYIHRNMYPGEKDFGVPLSKIQESILKI